MAEPLSMDLRSRVVADYDAGERVSVIAVKYSVSKKTIYNWLNLRRETGSLAARSGQPGRKPKLNDQREKIQEVVRDHPDLTLKEMISELSLSISVSALWYSLRRWGITLKKSDSCSRAATA